MYTHPALEPRAGDMCQSKGDTDPIINENSNIGHVAFEIWTHSLIG